MNRLRTDRLELVQLDAPCIAAWIARDGQRLEDLTGARFPEPVDAPPLFDADLPRILKTFEEGRDSGPWLFVLRETAEPVGAGGTAPMGDGTLFIGYSIWPRHQRRGYASEAVQALCEHGLAQPGVTRIRATIPVGHVASERVAQRAGLRRVGKDFDPDAGDVGVFELSRWPL
ncbi:MAG TPA: GNAT family protein [Myxococcales bacterium]|nr:GNAT family protein [Myxococcales bacterium]